MKYPKLPEDKDRRVKIPKSEYPKIRLKHEAGYGVRELGREYGVDHRLIQFILFPDRKKKNVEDRQERGGSKVYYNREKHRLAMRKHRAHKKALQGKELSEWRKVTRKDKNLPRGW